MNIKQRLEICMRRNVEVEYTFNEDYSIICKTNISKQDFKTFNVVRFNELMQEYKCKYKPEFIDDLLYITF